MSNEFSKLNKFATFSAFSLQQNYNLFCVVTILRNHTTKHDKINEQVNIRKRGTVVTKHKFHKFTDFTIK